VLDRPLRFVAVTAGAVEVRWDFDGAWTWEREPIYDEASEPPEVEEIREAWTLRGQVTTTQDGSLASAWERFSEVRAAFVDRADPIASVGIYSREEDGTETLLLELGGGSFEDFRWDGDSGGEPDRDLPRATSRTLHTFAARFSARLRLPESAIGGGEGTGIVRWEQTYTYEWVNGLARVTAETRIETRAGVDAVEKARTYAVIPIAAFGSSYTYATNDEHGIDYTILDADARRDPARTPRIVLAVSRIQQWGVDVGTTGPGTSPDRVSLSYTTIENQLETVVVTSATAEGPNARTFVRRFRPLNAAESETIETPSDNGYAATWTVYRPSPYTRRTIELELSGGGEAVDWEPVYGGFAPVQFVGALLPYELTVSVVVEKRGGTGEAVEFLFPPLLGAPWVLVESESSETDPVAVDPQPTADRTLWRRSARLVYRSAVAPEKLPAEQLATVATQVVSYKLGRSA
jgi:hypothetical protein